MYNCVYTSLQWDLYMSDISLEGISTLCLSVRKNYILKFQHFNQKRTSAFETGCSIVFFYAWKISA